MLGAIRLPNTSGGSAKSESSWIIDITLGPAALARRKRKNLTRNRIRLDKCTAVIIVWQRIDASAVRLTGCELGPRLWRAAIHPSGCLDLVDRDRAGSQQAQDNTNPARDGAVTPPPAPDSARFDSEQSRNTLLRNAEHAKSLAGIRSRAIDSMRCRGFPSRM
jgi:hypothetical protein